MAALVSLSAKASKCCLQGPEKAELALLADMLSVSTGDAEGACSWAHAANLELCVW